ncbi:hypothetical protein B0H11DRAFT_1715970, partial [Mycena galericulata]
MSGYLRQELRELEILDEITRMRYDGTLPRSVTGLYRRRLIRSFYAWKSNHRDPTHFHPELRWKAEYGPRIPEAIVYSEWRPSMPKGSKRKNAVVDKDNGRGDAESRSAKRLKPNASSAVTAPALLHVRSENPLASVSHSPRGLRWDNTNWSCAYDATYTILGSILTENPSVW